MRREYFLVDPQRWTDLVLRLQAGEASSKDALQLATEELRPHYKAAVKIAGGQLRGNRQLVTRNATWYLDDDLARASNGDGTVPNLSEKLAQSARYGVFRAVIVDHLSQALLEDPTAPSRLTAGNPPPRDQTTNLVFWRGTVMRAYWCWHRGQTPRIPVTAEWRAAMRYSARPNEWGPVRPPA